MGMEKVKEFRIQFNKIGLVERSKNYCCHGGMREMF